MIRRLIVCYRRFSTIAETVLYIVPCVLIGLFMLSMFSEVVLRTFSTGFAFLQEYPRLLMGYCVFWLLGVLFKRNRHVSVSFLVERLKGRAKRILMLFINVVVVGGSAMLLRGGIEIMMCEYAMGGRTATEIGIPIWTTYISLIVGVAFLLMWSIEAVVRNIAGFISSPKYAGQEA